MLPRDGGSDMLLNLVIILATITLIIEHRFWREGCCMGLPLMPKATAIWLVENTSLTFDQIADFCGMHILEIEAIADGEYDAKMAGFDPVCSSQLSACEIKRCENDPSTRLLLKENSYSLSEKKQARYTPRSKRQDKPDAIAWVVKYYPNISDNDLCSLIGTTKATIKSIKNKTHKNMANIKPRSPVVIGLCSELELDCVVAKLSRQ
jgi:hypothetical protein